MAGKKGRSGRKNWKKELKVKEIANLCEKTLMNGLKSKTIDEKKKLDIAGQLYGKILPKDIDLSGQLEHRHTLLDIARAVTQKEEEKEREDNPT